MSIYKIRKNFTALFRNHTKTMRGKIAFKTLETEWLETEHPVVALISIHSGFHKIGDGDLKMNAFLSILKSSIKGPITVLLSDRAHLRTFSLKHQSDLEEGLKHCLMAATQLEERYRPYFDSCKIAYWHSYIFQDQSFLPFLQLTRDLFQSDPLFKGHVLRDAEAAYTLERIEEFADKQLFIETTIEDILEQCAGVCVLSEKGYRFQFYPGSPCTSINYINDCFIPKEKQTSWIKVFLSIEKKAVIA